MSAQVPRWSSMVYVHISSHTLCIHHICARLFIICLCAHMRVHICNIVGVCVHACRVQYRMYRTAHVQHKYIARWMDEPINGWVDAWRDNLVYIYACMIHGAIRSHAYAWSRIKVFWHGILSPGFLTSSKLAIRYSTLRSVPPPCIILGCLVLAHYAHAVVFLLRSSPCLSLTLTSRYLALSHILGCVPLVRHTCIALLRNTLYRYVPRCITLHVTQYNHTYTEAFKSSWDKFHKSFHETNQNNISYEHVFAFGEKGKQKPTVDTELVLRLLSDQAFWGCQVAASRGQENVLSRVGKVFIVWKYELLPMLFMIRLLDLCQPTTGQLPRPHRIPTYIYLYM